MMKGPEDWFLVGGRRRGELSSFYKATNPMGLGLIFMISFKLYYLQVKLHWRLEPQCYELGVT